MALELESPGYSRPWAAQGRAAAPEDPLEGRSPDVQSPAGVLTTVETIPSPPQTPGGEPVGLSVSLPRPLTTTILASFVITFLVARLMVLLIMTHRIPSLYLHVGGTHVHHLNYGIFILSAVGGTLLLRPPKGKALTTTAVAYGIGLALTFDEFGMWIHLGGPYWQRASFDAVIIITGLLGLFSVAPALRRLTKKGWVTAAFLGISLLAFALAFGDSLRFAERRWSPIFQQIEAGSPP